MNQEFFYGDNQTTTVPSVATVASVSNSNVNKTISATPDNKNVNIGVGFAIFYLIIALFIFIWWIIGTVGFIMSLICFGYSGPMSDKFLGLIMAWVTGPFYWLYYIYNSNYCTRHVYYQQ